MNIYFIIVSLGLLIFFSHTFNELFSKTKIPNVLLLLLIGIIIGPVGGIITKDFFGELGAVFTNITLVVILFESGSNLKFSNIKKAFGSAFILTIFNFIASAAIAAFLANLIAGLDWISSVFVGAIIGGTSSAVVIPMVKQLKLGEKSTTTLFLESALSDVLCLIVGLAIFDGMKQGELEVSAIFSKMWKAFLFAVLLGIAGGFVWSFLLRLVRSIENSMFITLAFVFIIYGVVELLGFNGGIATLSYGIILGNSDLINSNRFFQKIFKFETSGFNLQEKSFFSEIVFLLQTYFFVYVGISIQFGSFSLYMVGFIVVILIILARPVSIQLFARKNNTFKEIAIMSVLTPKGLVPAVLASMPLQYGLINGDKIMDLGYSIVLFSIVICSILVIILGKDPLFFRKMIHKKKDDTELIVEETVSKA